MTELSIIQNIGLTPVGINLPAGLTEEDWEQHGLRIAQLESATQWAWADWWNYGEHEYGDRKAVTESDGWNGHGFGALANMGSVGNKFETSRRREVLGYMPHAEVSGLKSEEQQDEVLDWCESELEETGRVPVRENIRKKVKEYGGVIASLHTGDEESYTPPQFIESARKVMGSIDLDPASNDMAQETVEAKTYYTIDDDGLTKDWAGNVWMNPPYTALIINKFINKIVEHYQACEISQAIVLTNNNTDTSWFHAGMKAASAVCLTSGRINFMKRDGSTSSPTNGQLFFYFGSDVDAFKEEFSQHGLVMVKA